MSTKNLARTVIEGGRRHHNVWHRRNSNASARTAERMVSAEVVTSARYDTLLYPQRVKVYREFSDKLGPAERWLGAQAGRPWSKVRSELFARFDTRTTAGRHVLFDHLLPKAEREVFRVARRLEFYVDRFGILRKLQVRRKRRKPKVSTDGTREES